MKCESVHVGLSSILIKSPNNNPSFQNRCCNSECNDGCRAPGALQGTGCAITFEQSPAQSKRYNEQPSPRGLRVLGRNGQAGLDRTKEAGTVTVTASTVWSMRLTVQLEIQGGRSNPRPAAPGPATADRPGEPGRSKSDLFAHCGSRVVTCTSAAADRAESASEAHPD